MRYHGNELLIDCQTQIMSTVGRCCSRDQQDAVIMPCNQWLTVEDLHRNAC